RLLIVEAELHVVAALDPGNGVRDIHDLVGAVEGPAAVKPEAWEIRHSLAGSLGVKPRGETESDVGQEIQVIDPEDIRQGERLAVGSLERQQALGIGPLPLHFERDIHLMGAVDAPGEFVDQIRTQGMDYGSYRAIRRNVIAVRE